MRIDRFARLVLAASIVIIAVALPDSAEAARPVGLGQAVGGARLLVHYTTSGSEAITDGAAQQLLAAAERADGVYRSWGWPDPPSDAGGPADANNPDGRIDVYVHGINSPDDPQGVTRSDAGYTGLTLPSYIEIQPVAAAKPVVVSHELFHVFQRGVYRTGSKFLKEATAVWASNAVTGAGEWGYSYLTNPSVPLECPGQPPSAFCEYRHWPFFAVVAAHHGPATVLATFQRLAALNPGLDPGASLHAIDDALRARGSSLSAAFAEAVTDDAGLALARRAIPGTSLFLGPPGSRRGSASGSIDHLSARLVVVGPRAGTPCGAAILRFAVNVGPGIPTQPAVLRAGATQLLSGTSAGAMGDLSLPLGCATAIVVVPNLSTAADQQPYVVRAARTLPTPRVKLKKVPRRVKLGKRGRPIVRFRIVATGVGEAAVTLSCGRRKTRRTVLVDSRLRTVALRAPARRVGTCLLGAISLDVLGERPGHARSARVRLVRG
jgi:hypothetical protein